MSSTIAAVLVSLCLVVAWFTSSCASPAPPPSPTPDVNAIVQSAVGTALAQQRAQQEALPTATPAASRDAWLRAAKEFFPLEAEIQDIARGYQNSMMSLVLSTDSGAKSPLSTIMALSDRWRGLKDRLYLLPLPATDEGAAIRGDLGDAYVTLGKLGNSVIDLAWSTLQPTPTTKPGNAFQDPKYLDARGLKTSFDETWQGGRGRLLDALRQNGISMSELAIEARPTATPRPVPPPNTSIESKGDEPIRLSSGATIVGGTITNMDKAWTVTELEVTVIARDGTGKEVLREGVQVSRTTLRPGESSRWEYTIPASAKWETFNNSWKWQWQEPGTTR